jgi:hypothetical protein
MQITAAGRGFGHPVLAWCGLELGVQPHLLGCPRRSRQLSSGASGKGATAVCGSVKEEQFDTMVPYNLNG